MSNTSMHDYARMGAAARLTEIKAEIATIRAAFPELGGQPQRRRGGRPKAQPAPLGPQPDAQSLPAPRKRGKLSAAARKRISDAQKKRWAAQRAMSE